MYSANWRGSRYFYGFSGTGGSCAGALASGLASMASRVVPKLGPYSQATIDGVQKAFSAAIAAQPAVVTAISNAFEQGTSVDLGPVAAPLVSLFVKSLVGVNVSQSNLESVVSAIVTDLAQILAPCKDGSSSLHAAAPTVMVPVNVTEGDIGVDAQGRTWFYDEAGRLKVRIDGREFFELDSSIVQRINQHLNRTLPVGLKVATPTFTTVKQIGPAAGGSSALPFLVGGAALAAMLLLKR